MRRLIRFTLFSNKEISVRNILKIEINIPDIPNFGNELIQFRRMGESTRHKWVNFREGKYIPGRALPPMVLQTNMENKLLNFVCYDTATMLK